MRQGNHVIITLEFCRGKVGHVSADAALFNGCQYRIIINDPERVALEMKEGMKQVKRYRDKHNDAYHYNWSLKIDESFQQPFQPTHESMANLSLTGDQDSHQLAANLRRAFSGVVAGNVKEEGIRAIAAHGLFELHGDTAIMQPMDELLTAFVNDQRMKLPGTEYQPCYRLVS